MIVAAHPSATTRIGVAELGLRCGGSPCVMKCDLELTAAFLDGNPVSPTACGLVQMRANRNILDFRRGLACEFSLASMPHASLSGCRYNLPDMGTSRVD